MNTIFDVANWFLSKESMDQKKVQKLCYYAQAWSWTLRNKAIADCIFEAWAHGPVCRALWEALHDHTYFDIPSDELSTKSKEISDSDDIELLERVWATYGEYSGYQLESLTHRESPWIIARGNIPEYQRCTTSINPDDMKAYYSRIYSGDGIGE